MEGLGLPIRIQTILQTMVESPRTRSHLLLVGPPGSGKTTSARYFVEALHGKQKQNSFFGRALFLNSSDERGLEAVRSRVYPFTRSCFDAIFAQKPDSPKIIVFDEAETLTDQAQIALRPLLDQSPQKILIIFLCNSLSRIHPSIVHKFLVVPFESPKPQDFQERMQMICKNTDLQISGVDVQFRRGDIRFFLLNPTRFQDCAKLWHELFTSHLDQLESIFQTHLPKWTYPELCMFCLFCANHVNTLTADSVKDMIRISDTDFVKLCPIQIRGSLLTRWFKQHVREKLEPAFTPPALPGPRVEV